MRYVEAGGVRVSAIGLGCWQFGSKDWGYGSRYAQRTAVDLVHAALDLGINLVDTAEVYARGVSEAIVGRALEGRRDEAFLATKVLPVWPTAARVAEHGRLSALRLGVEVIDLYQVHWPNPLVPLASQMDGMRRLQDAGLVRHVGVSNFSVDRWAAAERELGRPVLSDQVQFSLLAATPSSRAVPYARERDRLVIAYSPLAKGLLGGRYGPDNLPAASARRMDPLWLQDNVRRAMPVVDAVRRIAEAHAATPAQVALAWLVQHPNTVAIPGASSVDQLRHNAEAVDLDLKEDEVEELDAEAARFEPISKPATAREMLRAARRGSGAPVT
jgi:aryl-alcohol dehydrogenase-like predicted oxidoreductase